MAVWLVRAGKQGQYEEYCLSHGLIGPGWEDIPDLSAARSRDDIKTIIQGLVKSSALANYAGQLWRLRHEIQIGDLVVLPLKTTSQIAIGRVTGPYRFDQGQEPSRRHTVPVEWKAQDIPRTAIQKDLLFSMGSAMTVCALNRNDAEHRVKQLELVGSDPGARVLPKSTSARGDDSDDSEPDLQTLDIERYALDRMTTAVGERFAGYAMQELVAAILRAEGYYAIPTGAGADGGIDVVAGSGPLGLDSPRVVVQVKSGASRVDAPTVQQLQGAISTHGADHGLLVAWGGLTSAAQQSVRSQHFRIRVWNADDLVAALTKNFVRLSDEIQARIPLKQLWVLLEDSEE